MDRHSGYHFRALSPAVTELGKPIRAKKYPQKNKNMTFYLVSVRDPEEGRDKKIVIRAPERWEAEVTVQVRRKT